MKERTKMTHIKIGNFIGQSCIVVQLIMMMGYGYEVDALESINCVDHDVYLFANEILLFPLLFGVCYKLQFEPSCHEWH